MKIALTPRLFFDDRTNETRASLDVKWIEFLESAGFEAHCIPFGTTYLENSLESIDGLILTGGGDLSFIDNTSLNRLRDEFEEKVFNLALTKRIPVLGICRGMQFIAHKFGAKIYKINDHVKNEHVIQAIGNDFKEMTFTTNSYHNYGVTLPKGFELLAQTSEENAVEAFANREKKIYGIMWHPERHFPFKVADYSFFNNIFKGLK